MGFLKGLSETSDEIHAQHTRKWCREIDGVQDVTDCMERTRRKVAGVVESIKLVPRQFSNTLEVTVFDGTDRIIGVWLGRKSIPGIDLGTHLILEGTVGRFEPGPLRIINPAYELLPQN
jgi:translation initiation factor 2B subunit (eIF-2B alpha/beta/delta family)